VNCSEQSSPICYLSWTSNMNELLWTVVAHLLSSLNKEYEWSSLTSHRPFVIQIEQGIWVNFFEQSSPIYHPSWTKNMTELLWPIIVHFLSILNKEYEWTSLNNHHPFVTHLKQVIWVKFFTNHRPFVIHLEQGMWVKFFTYHYPFVIHLEQGIWVDCFDQSAPIGFLYPE
jgi:hypothetical protein